MRRVLAACAVLACALLARADHGPDPARPHHGADGVRNPHGAITAKPLSDLLRWKREAWAQDLPPPPSEATPVVAPALEQLRANGEPLRRVGGPAARVPVPSATEPRWFMAAQHMNPAEAAQAHKDLAAGPPGAAAGKQ